MFIKQWFQVFLLLIFINASFNLFANDFVELSQLSKVNLQPYAEFFIDESGNLNVEAIHSDQSLAWMKLNQERINLGFNEQVHWFRFKAKAQIDLDRILELAYPSLDQIDFFQVSSNKVIQTFQTGDKYAFSKRPLRHRYFLFPVVMKRSSEHYFYFRVQTSGTVNFPIFAYEKSEFYFQSDQLTLLNGLYFGIMIVMCLYNIFIYFVLKDKSYLLYIGVVICTTLFVASLRGFAFQYLWPDWTWFNGQSIAMFSVIASCFAVFFTMRFLKLKENIPKLNALFIVVSILAVILSILTIIVPYTTSIRISLFTGTFIPILIIGTGIYRWRQGSVSARYFTIAWITLAAGTVTLVFSSTGIIPSNIVTDNANQIGSMTEVVLLSLALAQRFAEERRKRISAQESALASERKALETQRLANSELNQKVDERTQELTQTMTQLSDANTLLKSLSALDGLTGINNRRAFDERFELEWRRAVRGKSELSILMIDIDHFKKLNDQFGHLTGDECLKNIANIIINSVKRPSDFVARYGGEEFVVLLPETHSEGALITANKIRLNIESSVVITKEKAVSVTASIGLVTLMPNPNVESFQALEEADQALYLAKSKGRNKVWKGSFNTSDE